MNRKTKGALAATAGAVLLLGGAGSFALWSDSEAIGGDEITTGDLALNCDNGPQAWTDVSATGIIGGTVVNPASDYMVPGDTWQYDATCEVTADGKNMNAVLGVDTTTIPNLTITDPACGGPCITTTATMDSGAPDQTVPVTGGESYEVVVTVAFDVNTPNRVGVNEPVTVDDMVLTLQQVRS